MYKDVAQLPGLEFRFTGGHVEVQGWRRASYRQRLSPSVKLSSRASSGLGVVWRDNGLRRRAGAPGNLQVVARSHRGGWRSRDRARPFTWVQSGAEVTEAQRFT